MRDGGYGGDQVYHDHLAFRTFGVRRLAPGRRGGGHPTTQQTLGHHTHSTVSTSAYLVDASVSLAMVATCTLQTQANWTDAPYAPA
jgi:hypothetical protein